MDAEEVGLIGSERLAGGADRRARRRGRRLARGRIDDVKAVINLDASSARASDVQGMTRGTAVGVDVPVFQARPARPWRFSEEPLLQAAFLARFAAHGVLGLPIPSSVFAPVASGETADASAATSHHFAAFWISFARAGVGLPRVPHRRRHAR